MVRTGRGACPLVALPAPARATSPPRILVCGDVINDVLVKPLDRVTPDSDTRATISARPGGAAANQAAWMAHLGADVTFAGRVGARDAAYHRRELARAGVRARLAADREAETGSIVIMVEPDGERTMFTDRGANLRLRRADVPARLLDGAAALHLTGYTFCEPPLLEVALWLLGQARARGLAVTIDPGSAAFLARMGRPRSCAGPTAPRSASPTATRPPCSPARPNRSPWRPV